MITIEQAKNLKHGDVIHKTVFQACLIEIGPRGGKKYFIDCWRVNGKIKLWKTRPNDFSIPIKWGFYGPYDYLDNTNNSYFHLDIDCPAYKKENK